MIFIKKPDVFSFNFKAKKIIQTHTYKSVYQWGYTENRVRTKEAPDDDFVNTVHRRWKIAFSKIQSKYFKNNYTFKK